MAIKTFTAGEVLTASDTNTFLANSGLVFVKSQSVTGGAGVASVTVSNAFSSTYDSYKIIYSGGSMAATSLIGLQLGSTTTNYNSSLIYCVYGGGGTGVVSTTTGSSFTFAGIGYTDGATVSIEVDNPFLSQPTYVNKVFSSKGESGSFGGVLNNTTSYTAFNLVGAVANMVGGVITVYGYRKA